MQTTNCVEECEVCEGKRDKLVMFLFNSREEQ